jgi:hypothetical protein
MPITWLVFSSIKCFGYKMETIKIMNHTELQLKYKIILTIPTDD